MFSYRARVQSTRCVSPVSHTSLEMRRWWLFLIRTLTGLWTSSEDVPDAWSLSPSEPIFTFSWTMPTTHRDTNRLLFKCTLIQLRSFGLPFCFVFWHYASFTLFSSITFSRANERAQPIVSDFIHPLKKPW